MGFERPPARSPGGLCRESEQGHIEGERIQNPDADPDGGATVSSTCTWVVPILSPVIVSSQNSTGNDSISTGRTVTLTMDGSSAFATQHGAHVAGFCPVS